MSVYQEHKDELEKFEFMMGPERGKLAVTLDLITDALVLVGQHGVYCQSARQPGKPAMDIQLISKSLVNAKELVASVMDQLKESTRRSVTEPQP
jgi:predicted ATPase